MGEEAIGVHGVPAANDVEVEHKKELEIAARGIAMVTELRPDLVIRSHVDRVF